MEEKLVEITDKALEQITKIYEAENRDEGVGLRLGVVGGGCSGLSYKIDFDSLKEKDHILEFEKVKVFIDLKSAIYLKGITLDFKDGLNGKGFVFVNPNAANTCGCGESFSV
ncbi:MAG: iron-sulfur cluster assembly accessory protein [Halobacteriovorax sp.]|nr:iron-sulfur cluster assembly accessory protein [Halobacteriovorax sp.]|tara:strand:- start:266965 stop:267300 length:336 start_codon:yes stop_codon:yes gene_type:complete